MQKLEHAETLKVATTALNHVVMVTTETIAKNGAARQPGWQQQKL